MQIRSDTCADGNSMIEFPGFHIQLDLHNTITYVHFLMIVDLDYPDS